MDDQLMEQETQQINQHIDEIIKIVAKHYGKEISEFDYAFRISCKTAFNAIFVCNIDRS